MSGDLISRSALIEVLEKYKFGAISNDSEREYTKETVLNFVNKQPTVYNVDKVVEKLEDEKGIAFLTLANTGDRAKDTIYNEVMAYLNAAIEIVKAGGVE